MYNTIKTTYVHIHFAQQELRTYTIHTVFSIIHTYIFHVLSIYVYVRVWYNVITVNKNTLHHL